jgi:hypothetical protein
MPHNGAHDMVPPDRLADVMEARGEHGGRRDR